MKTKTIDNGNTKVWLDKEEEFIIVNKNEQLIDTIIDAAIGFKGNNDSNKYKNALVLRKSIQLNCLKANVGRFQNHRNKTLNENL